MIKPIFVLERVTAIKSSKMTLPWGYLLKTCFALNTSINENSKITNIFIAFFSFECFEFLPSSSIFVAQITTRIKYHKGHCQNYSQDCSQNYSTSFRNATVSRGHSLSIIAKFHKLPCATICVCVYSFMYVS